MSNATSTQDLGAALGILLRDYAQALAPLLSGLPQGARGYQTMCEVVHERQPSQAALAARLGIDRTAMTYLIDELVEAGLVERRPNPGDRRQRRIVATGRGRDTLAELCVQVTAAEDAALGALDEAERAMFRRLLFKAAGDGAVHTPETCRMANDALAT